MSLKKISKNILFNMFLVSFLFWVFLNNYFIDYGLSIIIFLFLSVFILNFIIYFGRYKLYFLYFLFIFIGFILWIFISNSHLEVVDKNLSFIEAYDNNFYSEIKIEIKDTYKIKEYENEYIAKLISINDIDLVIKDIEILWLVKIAKNFKVKSWDIIKSKSKIILINDFNEFEYKNFMLSKNIYFKTYLPFIDIIWDNNQNSIITQIDILREESLKIIYDIYPQNEAIFLWWILLWARESLPEDLKQNFNNSWLTHFIAVSGFNITILIIFFSFLFKGLPIFLKTILITIVIVLFTLLVWDTAPVIRASIMWLIAYYILMSGRKWSVFTILMFTAFVMAIISPFILNYDVSFALSFLAVFWIVYTQKFWKKVFNFMPETLAIREAFVLTMSALVFTLPIMLFNFWQVSILSPLANVAVTWTIPIAMLLWFISILAYIINPFFWYAVWYLDWIFLKWDMLVVNFFWTKDFSVFQYDFWEYKNYIQTVYFLSIIFIILYFKLKASKYIDLEDKKDKI